MNEQKNLMVAVMLVVSILFGFHYFYEQPKALADDEKRQQQIAYQAEQEAMIQANPAPVAAKPGAPVTAARQNQGRVQTSPGLGIAPRPATPGALDMFVTRDVIMSDASQRIAIKTPTFEGSINLIGGIIDDLTLTQYRATTDEESPKIVLLTPKDTREGYFGVTGWRTTTQTSQGASLDIPDLKTLWQVSAPSSVSSAGDANAPVQQGTVTLTPQTPVTLTYTNDVGHTFTRTISVDSQYMFHIKDSVENGSAAPVTLQHMSMIERHDIPVSAQSGFILHEGPIGVIDGKLHEIDYEDVSFAPKIKQQRFDQVKKSWIGFTDKYWLTALIPNPTDSVNYSFMGDDDAKVYYTTVEAKPDMLQPGQSSEHSINFFAGAKILDMLDAYEAQIGFDKFDLAVDFGWFYFLTKPMLGFLQFLHKHVGNFGIAILILTVLMKGLFFPLANKSYRSMSRMRAFAPQIEALKARYGEDRTKLNQGMMDLYKKHKINPVSGCLPMLIQAPVFFCLYKVLYVSLDMRQAPFYGWISDLSIPDPTTLFNLFGLIPFDPPSFLHIGAWPILMGLTMFLQQKMNPQPADKTQATMFLLMPLFMTFLFASFPAGLVIYWAWSNVLGIAQQYMIMKIEERRMNVTA